MNYRVQAVSINAARAVYALNWFDIAPGLKYIAQSLDLQIVQLGIVTTGFYVGLASFQLFGGYFASRIGNRRTETIGLLILGFSVMGSGIAPNLGILFLTRLLAGFGSAFFFSPALGMLAEIVPDEKYSFYVGAFNGSFNIGAAVGVLGWVYIDETLGWRIGLIIGGAMTVAMAIENYLVLRGVVVHTSRGRDLFTKVKTTLRERAMWILPIAGIGSMVSETVMGQFFVYYAEQSLNFSPSLSGSLGFMFLIVGFLGGIIGGYQYGRTKHKNATFVSVLVLTGVLTMAIPFLSSPLSIAMLAVLLGLVVVDGFSILYTIAAKLAPDKSMVSFSLSFVNFMQQAIGATFPFIFTSIVYFSGYTTSWVVMGAISFLSVILFPLAAGKHQRPVSGVAKVDFNIYK
ncbi:hypothetical protein IX51_07795 [uncultured archaeon]|nr:hypothetical protein IX51_07795 [uncultured archaeon]